MRGKRNIPFHGGLHGPDRTGAVERLEQENLSPEACLSARSRGRFHSEPDDHCELRTVFQRDRDRIHPSKSFRPPQGTRPRSFSLLAGGPLPYPPYPCPEGLSDRPTIAVCLGLNDISPRPLPWATNLGQIPLWSCGARPGFIELGSRRISAIFIPEPGVGGIGLGNHGPRSSIWAWEGPKPGLARPPRGHGDSFPQAG